MRRIALFLTIAAGLCLPVRCAFAQEAKEKPKESLAEKADEAGNKAHAEEESGSMDIWKWANFLILAGGLGYLIGKNAGPFFAARSASIREDMENRLAQRKDAEARAADVERRLANMEADIAALRAEGGAIPARKPSGWSGTRRRDRQDPGALRTGDRFGGQGGAHGPEAICRGAGSRTGGTKGQARMTPDAQDAGTAIRT